MPPLCHEETKISPYEFIFGRRPRLFSTLSELRQGITHKEFLADLVNRLILKGMQKNFHKAKESSKEYYDKRIKFFIKPLDPEDCIICLCIT